MYCSTVACIYDYDCMNKSIRLTQSVVFSTLNACSYHEMLYAYLVTQFVENCFIISGNISI